MRAVLGVLCTIALLTNVIKVNAEDGHLCEGERKPSTFRNLTDVFSDCGDVHGQYGRYERWCKVCKGFVDYEYGYGNFKAHSYTSYENAGHADMSHNFVIRCGVCGHDQRIVLVCEYEKTGYHVAPW